MNEHALPFHVTAQQIRIFNAVCRHKSYTNAAEELDLSQPAVSVQVKRIEDNNEIKLVEFIGKKLFLTPAGEKMCQACDSILQQLQDLNENIKSEQTVVKGELKIAMVTPAKYFIPYVLKAFLNKYPEVHPNITVVNRRRILGELKNNQYHLSIMGRVPPELNLDAYPFFKNELVVVAPPNYKSPVKGQIPIVELADEKFMTREVGSGIRIAAEELFSQKGIRFQPYMELGSTEATKQAVMAGLGLAVVPRQAVRIEAKYDHLKILDVEGFPLNRDWYVAKPKDKVMLPPAQAFMDFLKEVDINRLLAMSDTR
jgi:DNA-binding transcriptional LysR family regulator